MTPTKIRKVAVLGDLELWICEARSHEFILGPAVFDANGQRIGQLIGFDTRELSVSQHAYSHGQVSGRCVGCGELESHPIHEVVNP